jgi:hypothetical protein
VTAAARADLDISDAVPRHLNEVHRLPALVVTVCDRAHEELAAPPAWLHWSIPDPVSTGTAGAFDGSIRELRRRIINLVEAAS